MTTIDELIARLEAATGMDRDLDREIGLQVAGWKLGQFQGNQMLVLPDGNSYSDSPGCDYPSFTESIETALTLVPENASGWDCGRIDQDYSASVEFPVDVDGFHNHHARSLANAAIALTLAALKARRSP